MTGKYSRKKPETGRRNVHAYPPIDEEQGLKIIDKLEEIAEEKDASVAQISLAWLLHKPGVTSVLVGARTEKQLVDNLGATEISLSVDDMKKLDKVSGLKPEYPHYVTQRERRDSLFRMLSKET